jgi:hypothetical protein
MFGYLPTNRSLAESNYEAVRAWYWSALPGPFAETAWEKLLQTVRKLVKQTNK